MTVNKNDTILPRRKEFDVRKWENCINLLIDIGIVIHLAAKVGDIG